MRQESQRGKASIDLDLGGTSGARQTIIMIVFVAFIFSIIMFFCFSSHTQKQFFLPLFLLMPVRFRNVCTHEDVYGARVLKVRQPLNLSEFCQTGTA